VKRLFLAVAIVVMTSAFVAPASADYSDYGLESVEASVSTTQAGGHPDLMIGFRLKTDPSSPADLTGLHEPYARTKQISVAVPAGVIGNPNAVETCTVERFLTSMVGGGCPAASQVGVTEIGLYSFGFRYTEPVYNLPAPGGDTVARLGFFASNLPNYINIRVRSDGDYGLTASVEGIDATEKVVEATTTLWGVPAAPVHDTERMTPSEAFSGIGTSSPRPPGVPEEPFMINPVRCGLAQPVTVSLSSYQLPGQTFSMSDALPPMTGCNQVEFDPSLTVTPTSRKAGAPTGLDAELTIPQNDAVNGEATGQLRDAVVTLPQGMTIASGAADGLQACSDAEVGYKASPPRASQCPPASKLGSAEFDVPALSRVIDGEIYQRTPEAGNLFRIWLVTDELGVHVKLPGEIHLDPVSGQVTSLFLDNPQVPLRNLKLHFRAGPRAPLANPGSCGTYLSRYEFSPWTGNPPTVDVAPMTIDQGCDKGGFSPSLAAGSTNPTAGAFAPFVLNLTRPDGDQNVSGLEVTMPPGLLAKLAGVGLCPESSIPSGNCPASSQVGTTTVAAGPGSNPLWIPQPGKAPTGVYLTGPYRGAPYGLAVKVPAQAGPFDLGTVVTRAAIRVDPETTRVTVASDPLPQILEGVPVSYRTIHVDVDRPGFTLNPTSCKPKEVGAKVTSAQGAVATLADRFQVGSCADLPFKPKLSLRLKGGTRRSTFPALRAELKARPGDANIGKAVVSLPRSEFLEQGHIRTICTRVQFAADACPAAAIYGKARAFTPLLDQPLEGPVYLRSSNNPLPDLVADLRGPIDVVLVGRIDSGADGGIRTSFVSVPDAPVSKFVLSMQGGKKGLLVNSRNLCSAKSRADVKFTGQNGTGIHLRPVLANSCGKKQGKAPRRRAN